MVYQLAALSSAAIARGEIGFACAGFQSHRLPE